MQQQQYTSIRIPPTFTQEAQFNHFYEMGKKDVLNPEKAKKFALKIKEMNLPLIEVPSEEELNNMSPDHLKEVMLRIWNQYFLMAYKPLNILPI